MNLLGKNIDLSLPKQPSERVYTQLQLSRLFVFIRSALFRLMILALIVALSNAAFTGLTTLTGRERDNALKRQNAALTRTNERLQEAIDEIEATRAQGRATQCTIDNRRRHQAGQAFREAGAAFVASTYAAQGRQPTEDEKRLIAAYLADQEAAGKKPFEHRDCATHFVDAYYDKAPPFVDPEPCVNPDERGICQ